MPEGLRELSHVASKEKAENALRREPRERRLSFGSDPVSDQAWCEN